MVNQYLILKINIWSKFKKEFIKIENFEIRTLKNCEN